MLAAPIWRWTWGLLAANAAAAAVLGATLGFTVELSTFAPFAAALALVLAALCRARRVRNSAALCAFGHMLAVTIAFVAVVVPFTYIVAAIEAPLRDQSFAAFDRGLGFDWAALHDVAAYHTAIATLARLVYANTHLALAAVCVWLLLTGRLVRLAQLYLALVIAATLGLGLAAAMPAAGAYHFFDADDSLVAGLAGTGAGRFHVADLLAVRAGTLRHLWLDRIEGLVQAPSYHTMAAIFIAWGAWPSRRVAAAVSLFAAAVCFTALVIGGHFLFDVLLAITVCGFAIALAGCICDHERAITAERPVQAVRVRT